MLSIYQRETNLIAWTKTLGVCSAALPAESKLKTNHQTNTCTFPRQCNAFFSGFHKVQLKNLDIWNIFPQQRICISLKTCYEFKKKKKKRTKSAKAWHYQSILDENSEHNLLLLCLFGQVREKIVPLCSSLSLLSH